MSAPLAPWLDTLPAERLIVEGSLWSADLTRIAEAISAGDDHIDVWHLDVADGHFAPSLLFFPDLVAQTRALTASPLHVHLMVSGDIVREQIAAFAEAGADLITVHAEIDGVSEALAAIRASGCRAGLAVSVDTPIEAVSAHLPALDWLTLMGTAIGIKGAGLDERAGERHRRARALIDQASRRDGHRRLLAADGGIRDHTVPTLSGAGADTVVAGSLYFKATDKDERVAWLRGFPAGQAAA